jgi:hypothetical protein
MNLLAELADGLRLRRHYHTVLRELRSYTPVELADLGLASGDVARVAMEEAERRLEAERPAPRGRVQGGDVLAHG